MFCCKALKRSAADEAQYGIAHRDRRHRTRQPINHRKLADNGSWAAKCKNALGAGFRNHRKFEESVLDAIAAIAGITFPKQHPTGGKPHHLGVANNSLERCVGKPDGGRFGLRADLWLGASRAGVPWYSPVIVLFDNN